MNISQSIKPSLYKSLSRVKASRGVLYVLITVLALLAFEAFNFSTTDFALSDLLGDLRFMGLRWATLLAVAFCGIDFAGIVRLFSPQNKGDERHKVWYLFGAWFLAATMNAILTWWGVVMAMQTHLVLSESVVDSKFVGTIIPIFIALMVWVIRVLLIGTLSKKGDRDLQEDHPKSQSSLSRRELRQAQSRAAHAKTNPNRSVPVGFTGFSAKKESPKKSKYRPEPTYIPMQEESTFQGLKAANRSQRGR